MSDQPKYTKTQITILKPGLLKEELAALNLHLDGTEVGGAPLIDLKSCF